MRELWLPSAGFGIRLRVSVAFEEIRSKGRSTVQRPLETKEDVEAVAKELQAGGLSRQQIAAFLRFHFDCLESTLLQRKDAEGTEPSTKRKHTKTERRIDKLKKAVETEGCFAASSRAKANAFRFLHLLRRVAWAPERLLAADDAVGGLAFLFDPPGLAVRVECLNDGAVCGTLTAAGELHEGFDLALGEEQIRALRDRVFRLSHKKAK